MIGFLGKMQSGKDTSADYICSKYGYKKMAFAQHLKKSLQEMFGFTYEQMHDQYKKNSIDSNWGITPRSAMQKVGTDILRHIFSALLFNNNDNIAKNFWVKRADIYYKETLNDHKGLVIWSDVRFQNEVDYIIKNGGIIIKINRESYSSHEESREESREESHKESQHESEDINNVDYSICINNNDTKEALYKHLDYIMENINIYKN